MKIEELRTEAKDAADITSLLSNKEIDKVNKDLEDLKQSFSIIDTNKLTVENLDNNVCLDNILKSLDSLENYDDLNNSLESITIVDNENANKNNEVEVLIDAPYFPENEDVLTTNDLNGLINAFNIILKAFNLSYDKVTYQLKDKDGKVINSIDIPSLINSLE